MGILRYVLHNVVYDFIPVPGNDMDMEKQKHMYLYLIHPHDALPAIDVL
jgi:hypothetical protein